MAMKAKTTDVSKWQQGRPQWNYDPALQFWYRFVMCTLHDAMRVEADEPTDEALLARDWFARSEPDLVVNGRREYVSFDECCHWLGLNPDVERVALLEVIDRAADFDTDECFRRLEILSTSNPDDTEALFDVPEMFRLVAVRDQMCLL